MCPYFPGCIGCGKYRGIKHDILDTCILFSAAVWRHIYTMEAKMMMEQQRRRGAVRI